MNKTSIVAALVASGCAFASLANASPLISIGLQEAGIAGDGGILGAISTETTSGSAFAQSITGVSYGTFTINSVSGQDNNLADGDLYLSGNSINTSSSASGTLTVWISESGLTGPLGNVLTGLTENTITSGFTVAESTYVNADDAVFGTDTLLDSTTFSAIGTQSLLSNTSISGTYSVTEEFVVTANGAGSANSTINMQGNVPEPGTLALFGAGLLACALFVGRRRRSLHDRA